MLICFQHLLSISTCAAKPRRTSRAATPRRYERRSRRWRNSGSGCAARNCTWLHRMQGQRATTGATARLLRLT